MRVRVTTDGADPDGHRAKGRDAIDDQSGRSEGGDAESPRTNDRPPTANNSKSPIELHAADGQMSRSFRSKSNSLEIMYFKKVPRRIDCFILNMGDLASLFLSLLPWPLHPSLRTRTAPSSRNSASSLDAPLKLQQRQRERPQALRAEPPPPPTRRRCARQRGGQRQRQLPCRRQQG